MKNGPVMGLPDEMTSTPEASFPLASMVVVITRSPGAISSTGV
jgi:hypothetical protein